MWGPGVEITEFVNINNFSPKELNEVRGINMATIQCGLCNNLLYLWCGDR